MKFLWTVVFTVSGHVLLQTETCTVSSLLRGRPRQDSTQHSVG